MTGGNDDRMRIKSVAQSERGGEWVGLREHRVALGKMGERPVHRFASGIGTANEPDSCISPLLDDSRKPPA